jgi:predicted dehydrogenase
MQAHELKTKSNSRKGVNRRQFIGSAAAGLLALSGQLYKSKALPSEGDKLKFGLIGCGWYGMVDVKAAFKTGGVECLALCDVDSDHLSTSADAVEKLQGSRPKTFKDYRELLEVPDLQAVIIATPPHWHALPFIAALEKKLDIYCEKPLAYDIREGQAMVMAAERSHQIIQIGFQRRQSKAIQEVKDFIQQGNIGRVVQVDVQIHYPAKLLDPTPQNPPPSLDWDWWCGPAPKLPYSPQIGHFAWRLEKEYGNGHLVDWGIHLIDATRWVLKETMPASVQSAGGIYYHNSVITTPDILIAHFDFAACPVTWHHRLWGAQEYTPEISNGIFFYGEKGTVFTSDRRWVVIPKEKDAEPQVHEADSDMATLHMAEFLQAVKTRVQPPCSPREAYYSTSTVQLGMIAYDVQQKIHWDAGAQEIIDNTEAAQKLKRPYRSPWKHPFEGV